MDNYNPYYTSVEPVSGNGGVMPVSYNNQSQPYTPYNNQLPQPNNIKKIDPRQFETPEITTGGLHFTISDSPKNSIVVDRDLSDMEVEDKERKKRASAGKVKKSENNALVRSRGGIEKNKKETTEASDNNSDVTVESTPTSYTYSETTAMLHDTINQIDALNSALMQDFTAVRASRTMKNKYNVLVGLSENVGSLISNRISAIKEINSSISKSNDLDYKKYKDFQAAQSNVNDDKYVSDLYQAFLKNPQAQIANPQLPAYDSTVYGATGIVRADIHSGDITGSGPVDAGYLNYVANMTPEQNMMRYEGDPNVKQVVVYDASTGNKFFQVMNVQTGEVINNVPVLDQMFMEDTTLDLKTKIAKNINLNETFPIVVINDNITSQY